MKLKNQQRRLLRNTGMAVGLAFALGSASAIAHTFSVADADGDGRLTRSEYDDYVDDVGLLGNFDEDGDGQLNEVEWDEIGFDFESMIWDDDHDGYLDRDELFDGSFGYYDANDDGFWDEDEWNAANDDGWLDF